ncbi:MAG: family sodium-coupled anion symporter, partial [Neobacillus sp.]|nr:family sodium-coupled anion symporter [Neobacillus sp.]
IVTELTTNAVVVAAFLPVLASVGTAIGVNPLAMMLACMLSCNFAFMLPPATPPNAVAYGTGEIEMSDLIKCGFGLKIICLIIFPFIVYGITMGVFGFGV